MGEDSKKASRIALFANHFPGVKIAEYLASNFPDDEIRALYLTGQNIENDERIIKAARVSKDNIFYGPAILNQEKHLDWMEKQKLDAIVCVYWPWLLNSNAFALARKTINFHPAFLPINRGWFPHVHSIIDGTKTGVTLHEIETGADTGAIWAQKEVLIKPTDTAKEIYERLQIEIINLFIEKWRDIKADKLDPQPQDHTKATYHRKNELSKLDYIDINETYKARDLINKLRARSFDKKGFSYFFDGGQKIFVNIKLSTTNDFNS